MIKDGCKAPQFNVSCGELLVAWQGAIPGKFSVIEDVEQYLLTGVTEVRCPAIQSDVAGLSLPTRAIRYRVRSLDPTKMCLSDKRSGLVVTLLDCGNPARAIAMNTVQTVVPKAQNDSVQMVVSFKDTLHVSVQGTLAVKDTTVLLLRPEGFVPGQNLFSGRATVSDDKKKSHKLLTWKRITVGVAVVGVTGAVVCSIRKDHCGFGSNQTTIVNVHVH